MRVFIRKHKDKFIRRGYPWVFANIVDKKEGSPETGNIVDICDAGGGLIGSGLYHATSAIAVRFLSHLPAAELTDDLFVDRVTKAIEFRQSLQPAATHGRLIYGESDGLPGTVVDQYGDVLTWTTLSAGIDQRKEILLDTLESLLKPRAIVERNDVALRRKDDLPEQVSVLRGSIDGPVDIEESGLTFSVDVLRGPKTGFFIDQHANRLAIRRFSRGRRVLDPFCADGGFGLHAAYAGASVVDLSDTSADALKRAKTNASNNGLENVSFMKADALEHLGKLVEQKKQYDLVVLDPPAFAKSKRNIEDAERAYQRLNINALQLLSENGILATSSCSQAISEDHFLKIIQYSAKKTENRLRMLYRTPASFDHPSMMTMPETGYLKFFILQKMGDECP